MIMTKVILIQTKCPFLPLVLNENNNNEHTECHGIFMPFKGEICSKKIIISSCLNEAKVSTVNSDLQISLTFNECMKTLNELCVFTEFSYTLFTKRLLLICISLLKHVIYRRVNASQILLGATIPTTLSSKDQVKAMFIHFIKNKFPSSQVIYCLTTGKIHTYMTDLK